MRGINRITVHHEGWDLVQFTDGASSAARLESIRNNHLERLHAGDIGYHFVIDRAGRIWAGRSLLLQGAHVRDHNEHNIGVMVLGNFNRQYPSKHQYGRLLGTLQQLMGQYQIGVDRVYTHRELGPTTCPGDILQVYMDRLRNHVLI